MKIPQLPAGEIARRAAQSTESIEAAKISRAAAIAAQRASGIKKKQTPRPEHGQQIFVFNHLQKNHVVYSLTRAMNNNAALSQLPFNGKKSVPAALRKDLWHPFAHIKFPSGSGAIGLSAFQKLREYRKRHELEWGDDIRLDAEGEIRKLKDRAKAICDQKANSVADMAAVLNRLAVKEERKVKSKKESLKKGDEGYDPVVAAEEKAERMKPVPKKEKIGLIGEGEGVNVQILWGDIHDAEFAEKWAPNVEHGLMPAPEVRESKIWESRKKDPRPLEQEPEKDEEGGGRRRMCYKFCSV
ncbi:transcriptional regulation of mitochondrial recombination-domain-containing protein [Cadophora sp. MPI-SDFR-AT-0126]|nr:transcriptional regulation of mitochondrial recombination-domain-containing protein [Leotiomycetes sp. MPI-SDFR-AT-0126]